MKDSQNAKKLDTQNTMDIPTRKEGWLQRLKHHRPAYVSFILLIVIHAVVFLGPLVWRADPEALTMEGPQAAWSAMHPFGTDDIGRDVLSRLLKGGQVTLTVGLAAMLFSLTVGTIIGSAAGFFRGAVDAVLMRLTEAMMSIPNFFFVLVGLTVLGNTPFMVVLVIALSSWMEIARVIYGETLKWKEHEFVEAAHAAGASNLRVLARHILPQAIPSVVVVGTLTIAWSILTESAISYLGMGIQPPMPTWGNMLQDAQQYIWTSPMLGILPGIAIMIVVLLYNLLGDGLRDLLDPRYVPRRRRNAKRITNFFKKKAQGVINNVH